jgi:hypothetical protein
MRRFLGFLCFAILFQLAFAADPEPGYLANPGFENEAIKSVFFFSGNWTLILLSLLIITTTSDTMNH